MGKKVYLAPEALQRRVDAFKEIATKAKDEVGKIVNASSEQGDPMENPPLEEYTPKMREAAAAVTKRLAEIEECKKTIERLSSNGIGTKVGDYGIEIDVPDDKIDSKEKLDTWAKAAVDGRDLKSIADGRGRGPLPSGRDYNDLIKSMRANKLNPDYANFLIDSVGPENLTKIPGNVEAYNSAGSGSRHVGRKAGHDIANLLGENLATASRVWDAKKSREMADILIRSTQGDGNWGRLPALNAMLDLPGNIGKDGLRVPVKFGTEFLLRMGDVLEDRPRYWPADPLKRGPSLSNASTDPLSGVLHAMGGNPDAAHRYFVPDGHRNEHGSWVPGEKMKERWKLVTQEGRDLGSLSAAQAAVSSKRKDDNADTASSATWLTARSIEFFVDEVGEDKFSQEVKRNLAVLAANCSEEGAAVAQGGSPRGLGLKGEPSEQQSTFATLLYRIIDDKDAAATVSSAFLQEVRQLWGDATNPTTLNEKYKQMGQVFGFLNALGDKKVDDMKAADKIDEAEAARKKEEISIGVDVGGVVVSTAASSVPYVGPVLGPAVDVAKPIVSPIIVDSLAGPVHPDKNYEDPITGGRESLVSEAYSEVINNRLIKNPGAYNPELFKGGSGEQRPWFSMKNGRPHIEITRGRGDSQNIQLRDWALAVTTPPKDEDDQKKKKKVVDEDKVISGVDSSINTGVSEGTARISGEDGAGGESGSVKVKKIKIKR